MTTEALASLLPVAPRPAAEERLSSWLSRVAGIYGMSANALLAHFGLTEVSALTLEQGLSAGQGALIAARAGLSAQTIDGMTFAALAPHARCLIAPSARYFCPSCAKSPAIGRKAAALPWTFWCSVHGVRLWGRDKRPMQSFLPESVLERLDPPARRGAARLAAWAEDRDAIGETGAPTVSDLLRFLTASYRRPSPPSLAEQPLLSLEARRANHAFLTRPIARQALLVVAPEYDRFAPVLAKPVRPGLAALAGGSLLQNYALAVGVARLTENPVEHAAAALAAADAEGETSLRRVLGAWPWTTRRRIEAHLRCLTDSKSVAKTHRVGAHCGPVPQIMLESHKFRVFSSHKL
ncbi:TniQ family protein (plasmid) [Methylocystis sp. MJC1]|uniref:TniQ family protein n=1 Tax=Methylocystis sp. MJC1 TaxID=2654282 RepID=UPI001C1E41F6|nr:TniQ family protein [Methylocystis sp. MJC1]MBU6529404.1 TniQ family protein [Methylocystis sp. MJC1]UZX14138.1 TniQ family protein [Methylocystis sp. MJC1]